jgi:hypothetical protein
MFFFTKNKILKKYKNYREVGKELNQKIIDRYVGREVFLLSGKYLGLVKKDALMFDNESETVALMDFSINECRINGKTAVELYKEKVKVDNDIETEILDGLISSYTSSIEIIDIGFSQTAAPGAFHPGVGLKMPVADYCGQKLLSKRCFRECLVLPCQS